MQDASAIAIVSGSALNNARHAQTSFSVARRNGVFKGCFASSLELVAMILKYQDEVGPATVPADATKLTKMSLEANAEAGRLMRLKR